MELWLRDVWFGRVFLFAIFRGFADVDMTLTIPRCGGGILDSGATADPMQDSRDLVYIVVRTVLCPAGKRRGGDINIPQIIEF